MGRTVLNYRAWWVFEAKNVQLDNNRKGNAMLNSLIRHPEIPPAITEEICDLYDVMPDPLTVESADPGDAEEEVTTLKAKLQYQQRDYYHQNLVKRYQRQNRSNSLPAVHGNFVLLHRRSPAFEPLRRPSVSSGELNRFFTNFSYI